ncbi:hypothetical protein EDB81DRAFT_802672 [Dactylonectria macrodidyma]|uniref:Carbohydrate kinase PfkB domain-containing protein n=1 Tax=Dactylonectria macrodidyma TaxID=307937 RepID=A0A9P9EHC3_9HYPO|nr:hypothetical protein EDB81DRAFT_802672 [Dactylonectria macrodidyma]
MLTVTKRPYNLAMVPQTIAVIGGLDADLIMIANRILNRGESVLTNQYLEALGGKGAKSVIATYRTCHKYSLRNQRTNEHTITEKPPSTGHIVTTTIEGPGLAMKQLAIDRSRENNITVKMISAVGDDQYGEEFMIELNKYGVNASGIVTVPNPCSSICFIMVEHSTRENRCFFTAGATLTWKKENFVAAEQLGGGIWPDLVVAQIESTRRWSRGSSHCPAFDVKVEDTTGAE